jgi:hypothetical protein
MKLLNSAALFAVMFFTHRVSASTIGQRAAEVLYRGVRLYPTSSNLYNRGRCDLSRSTHQRADIIKTCNTGTMLCTFQRDETTGDSCQCPAGLAPVCSLFEAFTEWSTRNVSVSLKPSADTMFSVKPTEMRAIIARTRV